MNTLHICTERLTLKPHTQENLKWLNTLFNDVDEQYYDGDDPQKKNQKPSKRLADYCTASLTVRLMPISLTMQFTGRKTMRLSAAG